VLGALEAVSWASQSEERDFQNIRWRLRCRWYCLFHTFSLVFEMVKGSRCWKILKSAVSDVALTDI
jgi:hypothetical protein